MLIYSIIIVTNKQGNPKMHTPKSNFELDSIPTWGTCDAFLIVRKIFPDNNDQDNNQELS